jgi:hypothetical protein
MTITKTDKYEESDESDFVDLLLKEERKEQMDSSSWTKVKIDNVEIYNGFITGKRDRITGDDIVKKCRVLTKYNKPPRFICKSGGTKHINKHTYKTRAKNQSIDPDYEVGNNLYESKNIVVVEISDLDGKFSKKIPIKPNYDGKNEEILSKLNKKNFLFLRKQKLSFDPNYEIKLDNNRTQSNVLSTYSNDIKKKIISNLVLFSPLIIQIPLLSILGITYPPSILPMVILLIYTLCCIYLSRKIENYFRFETFKSVNNIDTDKIPETAKITNYISGEYDINYVDADVSVYKNGDIVIKYNNKKWIFQGHNKIPSEESKRIFRFYGKEFESGKIPIKYYKNNPTVNTESNKKFLDTTDQWILELEKR